MQLISQENILAGFSDRSDGDLALYNMEEAEARQKWHETDVAKAFALKDPCFGQQVHGRRVLLVEKETKPLCVGEGDALITALPDQPVGVFSADCLPILFWHSKAVAAAHAGWRGSCKNIAAATVGAFQEKFGIPASQIRAAIGPCIGGCCLELGDEVFMQFTNADAEYQKFFVRQRKWHLDLVALNRFQLISAGLQPENVEIRHHCTFCKPDQFFSFRRQKKRNGSMFSFVVKRKTN